MILAAKERKPPVEKQRFVIPGARLAHQHAPLQGRLDKAIARVIRRAVFTPAAEVAAFEAEFAAYVGVNYAIGVASGSAALLLALKGLGIEAGDEVISVPNVDISASAPISQSGARLVWVDIDPRSFNLEPSGLAGRITPKTRAIVVTHMYGQPAELDSILAVADRHGLPLVEDAALATGATYRGRPVGSFGQVGCFSFSPGKLLGAFGKAGMVVTNDRDIAHRVKMFSSYGFRLASLAEIERGVVGAPFVYEAEGYNARLDELQAAVLRVKLPALDGWTRRRQAHAALYRDMLAELEPEHVWLPQEPPGAKPAYRVFVIRTRRRQELMRHLAEAGIWSGLHYVPPLHLQPLYHYLGYQAGSFPQTEQVAEELLCLPTIPELTEAEVERVGQTIRHFFLA